MKLTIALLAAGACLFTAALKETSPGEPSLPPRRIIATAPSNAEIICALGAGDRLVGVSPYVTYPPRLRALRKVGGIHDPDLETILALRPDLVVLRGHNVHVERLCSANNIRLYADKTDSLPSIFVTITELGDILGLPDEASNLGKSLSARLDAVRDAAKRRPRPKVLLTLRSLDKLANITTVARGSYMHAVIELAGGQNIFGDLDTPYPQVGLEEIIARQPDLILEAVPGEDIDDARRRVLLAQWQAVQPLRAAQERKVHYLTEDYILTPSPRVALLAEKLSAIFASEVSPGEE